MTRIADPIIIDVEASGFGPDSYPIEVGVAFEGGRKFCALIKPAPQWTHWDASAEHVHGITREMLRLHGSPLHIVATKLNVLMAGRVLYSDAWVVDRPWLVTLFHAARMAMNFRVSPLEAILDETQMARWHATREQVMAQSNLLRHRASNDAWIIQETYKRTAMWVAA